MSARNSEEISHGRGGAGNIGLDPTPYVMFFVVGRALSSGREGNVLWERKANFDIGMEMERL